MESPLTHPMGDDNMSLAAENQLNSKPPHAAEDPTFDGFPPPKEVIIDCITKDGWVVIATYMYDSQRMSQMMHGRVVTMHPLCIEENIFIDHDVCPTK